MIEIRIFRINKAIKIKQTESGQSKMNPSVGVPRNKHRQPATSLSELLSTIIRGRERSDQESAAHGKSALAI